MSNNQARQRPLAHMPCRRRVAEIVVPVSRATRVDAVGAWLLARVAEALEVDPLAIDPMLPTSVYRFGAAEAKELTPELEQLLRRGLPEAVFGADRSVRAIARSRCIDPRAARTPTLPLTREATRRLLLARAARLPRRPTASPGAGPRPGPAGCSPSQRPFVGELELALAS